MENNHTPGPWMIAPNDDGWVWDKDKIGICRVAARHGPSAYPTQQAEANARLIAAAPDMLEALIESHKRGAHQTGPHATGLRPDICWLCSIISKASA